MQLVSKKDFMFTLAAILVVALGFMAFSTAKKSLTQIKAPDTTESRTEELLKQSNSDEVQSIQTDLDNTDFSGVDSELQNIEKELNKTN
jgi:hypothetical protein